MTALVQGWLVATLFFVGLSLGALVVLALHNLTGGRWGEALRAPLVATASALPVTAIAMLLPLAFHGAILQWTSLPPDSLPQVARAKLPYFDPAFLILRALVVLGVWLGVAWWIAGPRGFARHRGRSIVALIAIMVTMLIFSTDWMVAADPRFYSTIYAVLELSGEIVGAFALAFVAAWWSGSFVNDAEPEHGVRLSADIANLLLGFVLLWVYLSFMQWLIIWSGNLPEEIGWYLDRGQGGWLALLLAVVALHAVVPIAALIGGAVKNDPRAVAIVAAILVVAHLLDLVWRVAPSFHGGFAELVAGIFSFLVVGAAWSGVAIWFHEGRPWPIVWRRVHA